MILPFDGRAPKIHASAFIAPNATVIGDVSVAEGASVWFGCILRADVGYIRIGARTNIQDATIAHMTHEISNLDVGADVTVGHRVILHGCRVEDACLIGMGAIVLDNAVIGRGSLVGAGAVVTPRTVIPEGSLVLGNPAKVIRAVNDRERQMIVEGGRHYVENGAKYAALFAAPVREEP